jgi:uncharacterized delta-60 repeat protein
MLNRLIQRARHAQRFAACTATLLFSLSATAQVPGSFDSGFAVGLGRITSLSIGPGNDEANDVAIQADGKIVLVGVCSNGSNKDFCVARLNVDGSLDASFVGPAGNGNGKFMFAVGSGHDIAYTVAIQPLDQKIVIAGSCANGSVFDLCVARLNTNGSLDANFTGPNGNGDGRFMFSIGTRDDEARAIEVQADGKIVIAGACSNTSVPASGSIDIAMNLPSDFCLARLNTNGGFDTSFVGPSGSAAGRFMEPIGSVSDVVNAIALQADGKIVLAGHCSTDVGFDFCAARLNTNGSLDSGFDGPGAGGAGLGSGNGKFVLPIGNGNDVANAVVIQNDGKLVLAGHCKSDGVGEEFCLARLHTNGSLDTSFTGPNGNANGRFLFRVGNTFDYAFAIATQFGGKLTIAGYCLGNTGFDLCAARMNSNGAFDTTFDGPHSTPGNGKFLAALGATTHFSTAIALQSNGKIVVAGTCAEATTELCVARFNSDPLATACAADIDGDGRVLALTDSLLHARLARGSDQTAALTGIQFPQAATRNNWNAIWPYVSTQATLDIDGDGDVLVHTDSLIHARIALGLTGARVTEGVAFQARATRRTWTDIRNHMNAQCGMSLQ